MALPDYVQILSDIGYTTSSWYSDFIASVSGAAGRAHRQIQVFSEKADPAPLESLQPVVIVTNGSAPYLKRVIGSLHKLGKKIILAGVDSDIFDIPYVSCVTQSRRHETLTLMQYFIGHGYSNLAFVGFRRDGLNDMYRYHLASQSSLPAERLHRAAFFWEWDIHDCLNRFTDSIAHYNAAICPNDAFAVILLHHCRAKGIRIPEDILIGSFSNMLISSLVQPGITSIAGDFEHIGRQAYHAWEILCTDLKSDITLRVEVPSRLIVRGSTAFLPMNGECAHALLPDDIDVNRASDDYFESDEIQSIFRAEKCLSRRDSLDLRIIGYILDKRSYEFISQQLFLSISSLHYRINKIYGDAGVAGKNEFVALLRKCVGDHNPFPSPDGDGADAQLPSVLLPKR
jgi:DNA-binding LacI/PurR family transcriptional regulator